VAGTVVHVHDGEPDHVGRRSQLALVPYLLGQAKRIREGVGAIAGNYVTIAIGDGGGFVTMVHLREGSLRVAVGDAVTTGQAIAECGNSGNSTQPHVHLQVTDRQDLVRAQGVPLAFRDFGERRRGATSFVRRESAVPGEGSVVTT
jgi:murein DD-endopeptidase MepM/ murein hydrolase activator NlpD